MKKLILIIALSMFCVGFYFAQNNVPWAGDALEDIESSSIGEIYVPHEPSPHNPDWFSDRGNTRFTLSVPLKGLEANKSTDRVSELADKSMGDLVTELFPEQKESLSYTVPKSDTHELLSDGKTWIPKDKTYTHGADNEYNNSKAQKGVDFINLYTWEKFLGGAESVIRMFGFGAIVIFLFFILNKKMKKTRN